MLPSFSLPWSWLALTRNSPCTGGAGTSRSSLGIGQAASSSNAAAPMSLVVLVILPLRQVACVHARMEQPSTRRNGRTPHRTPRAHPRHITIATATSPSVTPIRPHPLSSRARSQYRTQHRTRHPEPLLRFCFGCYCTCPSTPRPSRLERDRRRPAVSRIRPARRCGGHGRGVGGVGRGLAGRPFRRRRAAQVVSRCLRGRRVPVRHRRGARGRRGDARGGGPPRAGAGRSRAAARGGVRRGRPRAPGPHLRRAGRAGRRAPTRHPRPGLAGRWRGVPAGGALRLGCGGRGRFAAGARTFALVAPPGPARCRGARCGPSPRSPTPRCWSACRTPTSRSSRATTARWPTFPGSCGGSWRDARRCWTIRSTPAPRVAGGRSGPRRLGGAGWRAGTIPRAAGRRGGGAHPEDDGAGDERRGTHLAPPADARPRDRPGLERRHPRREADRPRRVGAPASRRAEGFGDQGATVCGRTPPPRQRPPRRVPTSPPPIHR